MSNAFGVRGTRSSPRQRQRFTGSSRSGGNSLSATSRCLVHRNYTETAPRPSLHELRDPVSARVTRASHTGPRTAGFQRRRDESMKKKILSLLLVLLPASALLASDELDANRTTTRFVSWHTIVGVI